MSINDVKGKSHVSGTFTITILTLDERIRLVEGKLLDEFPGADLKVFSGSLRNLAQQEAYGFKSNDFRFTVRQALLKTAKLIWPEGNYDDNTPYNLLYYSIKDWIEKRDEQTKSYRKPNLPD